MDYDILVIGGGPIGLLTAYNIAKIEQNLTITVLEEHKEIGLPQHCAGIISFSCLRVFDISPDSRIIINKFRRAKVSLPGGYELTFSKSTPVAVLVDRVLLEKKLAEKAEGKGVKILTRSTVLSVKEENNYVNILYVGEKLKGNIARASIVINAEGLGRRIARQVFYIDEKHHTPLKAYMEDYTATSISSKDLDMVRLYVGSTYSKGLFAWCIPIDKETVRIGVASREKLMEKYSYVKKVVDKEFNLQGKKHSYTGLINTSGPLTRFVSEKGRIILVGDSAGQDKPTTGGGLYYGGVASRILASKIVLAYRTNSIHLIRNYENEWWKLFRREFKLMLKLRRILDTLTDDELIRILKHLDLRKLESEISLIADFDLQSRACKNMLTTALTAAIKELGLRRIIKLMLGG